MDEVHILLKNTYKTNVMKNMISELQQSYNYPNVNFPYLFYKKKKKKKFYIHWLKVIIYKSYCWVCEFFS